MPARTVREHPRHPLCASARGYHRNSTPRPHLRPMFGFQTPVEQLLFNVELELFNVEMPSFNVEMELFNVEVRLFNVGLELLNAGLELFNVGLELFNVELGLFNVAELLKNSTKHPPSAFLGAPLCTSVSLW